MHPMRERETIMQIGEPLTPYERLALLARQVVVSKLETRKSLLNKKKKEFPIKPDYSDFVEPFRIYLRKELLLARIQQAKEDQRLDRLPELRKELVEAERDIIRFVL
jgi:hypothetical protein